MSERSYNVLFLCTGNSARSILAEAALRRWGAGKFQAFSAGSQPRGEVHPLTIELLRELSLPTEGLRSKSWDEFTRADAPRLDFVLTVCDNAVGEVCPIWPGQPMTAHWGVADPAAVEGSLAAQRTAFHKAFRELEARIKIFANLPIASLERIQLQQRISDIRGQQFAGRANGMNATDGLPNLSREQFRVPRDGDFARATPSTHPPRILLLYGSLRQRSYSRLLAEEAARLLNAMGAETRFFNPAGLPLPDETSDTHPKVRELRELAHWAEGMVWSSPERHGAMSGVMKAQIDWIPLSVGSVRPTQGKTLAVMQVCGGSQSFNAVNQMRVLGRWMRMITIPNQSSVAKAYQEFDDGGRMKPSSYYDRVVDVMEELMKFTLLTRDVAAHLVDRYSERKEHAAARSGTGASTAADDIDRVALPASARPDSNPGCCGGAPKTMADACCAQDEDAKAAGHASCGCSQESSTAQACCR